MLIVYCLTSSGGDLYEAMTRLSLATVRFTNPGARIEIACDQPTHQALEAVHSYLLAEADSFNIVPTIDGSANFRNRFVKTQLGRLIDGPFLFLDSDIVVRQSLEILTNLEADIAAAPNHSSDHLAEQISGDDQANLNAMRWQVCAPYVNGGVIWYGGTAGSFRFAEAWHEHWIANVEHTGRFRDQPALNYTLFTSPGLRFRALEHCWNAQYKMNQAAAANARIWHTYSSSEIHCRERFAFACQSIRPDQPINPSWPLVERLVSAENPYTGRYTYRNFSARVLKLTRAARRLLHV